MSRKNLVRKEKLREHLLYLYLKFGKRLEGLQDWVIGKLTSVII